jgi:uncharacterized protein (DUF362 family)
MKNLQNQSIRNRKGELRSVGGVVSLVRTKNPEDIRSSISEALTLIGFKLDNAVKSVVIKPNLCYYWDSSTGNTTDPRIVAAVIDLVREGHANVEIKVAEADASAMKTKHVFSVLGYEKLAKDKDVELVNLSIDVLEERTVKVGRREIQFKIPQLLVKSDLFVSVPKLKVMRATKITCAMKNIFGCIGAPRKIVYHPFLNEAIVGINKILHPHLTIVDGIIALGRYPLRLDLIMAATDPFSADWVACQTMGYNPARVEFLKIAIKEKVGSSKGITTKGESPAEFKKIFPRPGLTSSNQMWSLQSWLLKAYRKMSGDIIPPGLEEA